MALLPCDRCGARVSPANLDAHLARMHPTPGSQVPPAASPTSAEPRGLRRPVLGTRGGDPLHLPRDPERIPAAIAQLVHLPGGARIVAEGLREEKPETVLALLGVLIDEESDADAPALDAILRADPDAPACLALRGALALQEGRPAEALGLLERARPHFRADPVLVEAWLGGALGDLGRWEEAEPWLRRALERSPRDPDLASRMAVALTAQYKDEAALELLARACKSSPRDALLRMLHGTALLRASDYAAAASELRASIKLRETAMAAQALAAALAAQGRLEEASEWSLRAARLDPGDEGAAVTAALVLEMRGKPEGVLELLQRPGPLAALARAEVLGSRGDAEGARGALRDAALRAWVPDAESLQAHAATLQQPGLETEAAALFDAWLAHPGLETPARRLLLWQQARLRARTGTGPDPGALPAEVRAMFPDEDLARLGEATLLIEAGRHAEALDVLERVGPMDVDNVEVMLEALAQECGRRGQRALEERAYRVLLAREPDDTLALGNLARRLRDAGRLEEAQTLLRRAVDAEPWDVFERLELAGVLGALGRPEEARRLCEEGLSVDYEEHDWVTPDLLEKLRTEAARGRGAAAGSSGAPLPASPP